MAEQPKKKKRGLSPAAKAAFAVGGVAPKGQNFLTRAKQLVEERTAEPAEEVEEVGS